MKQSDMIIRWSICIFCTIIHLNSFSQLFYYGFDKKIVLTPKTNEYTVKLKSTSVINNFKQRFNFLKTIDSTTFVVQNNADVLKNDMNTLSVYPVCNVNNRTEIYPTNEIIFKYKNLKDTLQLNVTLEKYNVTLKEISPYYIIVETNKEQDVFTTANIMYESGSFYYVYPNFIVNAVLSSTIPTDQFFNKQFYLYNTGQTINDGHVCTAGIDINATKAWDITKGKSNITIAVLDEGVTSNHPDLPNTRQIRLNGSNFESLNGLSVNDPSPLTYHAHGNACAGIIAASHNSEGVAGIAPECKIMPITFPYISGYTNKFANAINFAVTNGAQIISN
jgi:subtilisin family serine protease